jgi:hypothetical protein
MSLLPLGLLSQGGGGGASAAFEQIASANGTGSANTITFSSIPSTYKHLQIRVSARSTFANTGIENANITVNGLTSGYSYHYLNSDGGSMASFGQGSQAQWQYALAIPQNNQTSGIHASATLDILDYADTNKFKTMRGWLGYYAATRYIALNSGSIQTTSAITSISFVLPQGNWTTSSRFSLYGIKG